MPPVSLLRDAAASLLTWPAGAKNRSGSGEHAFKRWRLPEADLAVGIGPVLTELLEGARDLRTRNAVHAGFGAIAFIEADQRTWDTAGTIRRRLRAGNQVIGFADTIIAAIAVQHGLALYALDRDYQRIDGLRLRRAGALDCA